jgi:hypothetical protein
LTVSRDVLFHGSEPQNLLGIVEATMRNIAHEAQYELDVLPIDFIGLLHSLTDQTQNFQTTEDHLMLFYA